MPQSIEQMKNMALQRRNPHWYVGKVVMLTGRLVSPEYPHGYYRVTGVLPDGDWSTERLLDRPQGEPIYIHDGSRDLKADPMTVVPGIWEWLFWFGIWGLVEAMIIAMSYEPVLVTLFFLPWLAGPFFTWFVNVEPVRGTKVAMGLIGVQAALAVRHRHDRIEFERSESLGARHDARVAEHRAFLQERYDAVQAQQAAHHGEIQPR